MNIGQLISGWVLSLGGFILVIVALFYGFKGDSFIALIYGLPALVVGLIILFNRREDEIEGIKRMRIKTKTFERRKKK